MIILNSQLPTTENIRNQSINQLLTILWPHLMSGCQSAGNFVCSPNFLKLRIPKEGANSVNSAVKSPILPWMLLKCCLLCKFCKKENETVKNEGKKENIWTSPLDSYIEPNRIEFILHLLVVAALILEQCSRRETLSPLFTIRKKEKIDSHTNESTHLVMIDRPESKHDWYRGCYLHPHMILQRCHASVAITASQFVGGDDAFAHEA